MAIDIRAGVSCSLGVVISGSIGDDYIQGSGLIKTQGSVLLSGLITPDIGTIVTFEYTKSGITRSIPRKLRVMSSFADPFRGTTQVELGCKLTYLSDLEDPIDWTAFDDPDNAERTEDEARVVTIPISAASIMNNCLAELGITASSNPLTNKFSIATFSFDGGYVPILSDLLVSESYCGYLDTNEVLQVFFLAEEAGSGPVFTGNDIIDLGPIGVGQLPGEAVTVSYSTLRLRPPEPPPGEDEEEPTEEELEEYQDNIDRINWERSSTIDSMQSYYINIRVEAGIITIPFTGITQTITETTYQIISYRDAENKPAQKEVPARRTTTTTGPAISELASVATAYYQEGTGSFNNATIILSLKEEEFSYNSSGDEIELRATTFRPAACILAAGQFDWVYEGQNFVESFELMPSEYIIQTKDFSGNYSRTITSQYLKWAFTQGGEQATAIANQLIGVDTLQDAVEASIAILGGGLVHNRTTEAVEESGARTSQERPSAAERINAEYAKEDETGSRGSSSNGFRTESQAELELAVGSAAAQRRIELSMPYAPDDTFVAVPMSNQVYTAIASDAPAKANRYGRVQNRLLLGNRSGISLQIAPDRLPSTPYSPLFVQAGGLTALYRANGTSWAFDSNGIVASVDALFWAGVGGSGTVWFPVAPGITTLPATPVIVDTAPTEAIGTIETVGATPQTTLDAAFPEAVSGDGVQDTSTGSFWVYDSSVWNDVGTAPGPTMDPVTVFLPYNETVIFDARIRLLNIVSKFDYSLELLTEIPSLTIYLRAEAKKVILLRAEAANLIFTGQVANLPVHLSLRGAVSNFALTGFESNGGTVYDVTNSGSSNYLIDGAANPTLTVIRGTTYFFEINAPGHPFWLQTTAGVYNSLDTYSTGVTNGGTAQGRITWQVAPNTPSLLYYVCQFHSSMNGQINVVNHVLRLGVGSFTFNGQPSTLQPAIRMPADSGEFVLSGQSVRFVSNAILSGATGVYEVSPANVALVTNLLLIATGENFTLSGFSSDAFILKAFIALESTSFDLNGQLAEFTKATVLESGTASYVLSGLPANLVYQFSGPTVNVGTEAPLLGAAGAVDYTGWTRIQNASADDSSIQVTGWPFTFSLAGNGYTSGFLGSNSYITFGGGSSAYSGLSASNPNLPKIFFGAADNSYQRVYTKIEGDKVVRIRYEGNGTTIGTPGSPGIVVELAFFKPAWDGEQIVELRVGNHNRLTGLFMIASASSSYASETITANSSWVFVGNSTGTSWTLTSNRYVSVPLRNLALEGSAGNYDMTGQPAGSYRVTTISSEAGNLSLDGQAAGIIVDRVLTAEMASYSLTGENLGSDSYFSNWATQVYGYEALINIDWWAD